jgi:hypothetical protein
VPKLDQNRNFRKKTLKFSAKQLECGLVPSWTGRDEQWKKKTIDGRWTKSGKVGMDLSQTIS